MTDHRQRPQDDDDALEAFFAAARRTTPAPSDSLLARVMADALAAQEEPLKTPARMRPQPARPGLLAQLREALGGWPAFGGLAAAGVMGLAIGITAPLGQDGLAGLASVLSSQGGAGDAYLVDLMPELDFDTAMELYEG
ncbi:MAG: hypothetical protein ACNA7O_14720 [Rhodobacterales bacterium]